jgi:hypothetical protein
METKDLFGLIAHYQQKAEKRVLSVGYENRNRDEAYREHAQIVQHLINAVITAKRAERFEEE